MPKLVSELAQGNTFSRSSDGGALADSATRVWKVILNTPDESLDIFAAIGVNIGDVYSQTNPIPCVSVEGRADGESRLVRIITAQYRTSAGSGGSQQQDPKAVQPADRFASFSVSTSYMEMPARSWYAYARMTGVVDWDVQLPNGLFAVKVAAGAQIDASRSRATNPVGDIYDDVTRLEPVVNFSFRQFEQDDPTWKIPLVGRVNSNVGSFGSLSLFPRSTLLKGINIEQHVETWGDSIYRGFMVSYEFAYRTNVQKITANVGGDPFDPDLDTAIGWDIAIPQTGFNVKALAPPNAIPAGTDIDYFAQPLKHGDENTPQFDGKIIEPLSLPDGIATGDKVRAMVKVFSYKGGGASQTPSAQPVLLDDRGYPRKGWPIINRFGVHEQFDFTTLGLRLPI